MNPGTPGLADRTRTLSNPGLEHIYTFTPSPRTTYIPIFMHYAITMLFYPCPGNDTGHPPTCTSEDAEVIIDPPLLPFLHPNLGNSGRCSSVSLCICPLLPTCVSWSHHPFLLGTLQLNWIFSLVAFLLPYDQLCTLLSDNLLRHNSDYVIQTTHISLLPYAN